MSTGATIAFVTGANTGIGRAVAAQLAQEHGYHVIIGSRKLAAGEEIAKELKDQGFQASAVQLDLASDDSIHNAIQEITKFGRLDVLINNAGILNDYIPGFIEESKDMPTRARWSQAFDTNAVGPAILTEALLPLLQKSESPRVVFVSSIMGSLTRSLDKTTAWYSLDYRIYDSSKAALNMIAINFARILDRGFVNVVCPGLNNTALTRHMMGGPPEIGAKHVVAVATSTGRTGTFSDVNGEIPW